MDPEELRRVLGTQLAALRTAARLSQQQIARRTGYSRSSVAHAEAGRQHLRREFWVTADRMTGADGALLSGWESLRAAVADDARQSHEDAVTAAYTAMREQRSLSVADEVTSTLWDHLGARVTRVLDEWVDEMNRRGLLRNLRAAVGGAVAAPFVASLVHLDPEESARVVKAVASPGRVDPAVIEHLSEMHRLLQAQDDALGARSVLGTAMAQRDVIRELLGDCPSGLRSDLLTVSAGMSCSIGHYLNDLDNTPDATRYFNQARTEAEHAGNDELEAYILCDSSQIAVMNGDVSTGAVMAEKARTLTTGPRVAALAHDVTSRVHSVRGEYAACMSGMERSREILASSSQDTSPAYYYDEVYLLRHHSTYLVTLGKPGDAVRAGEEGVRCCDPATPDASAYTTLALTVAHAAARQVDDAAATLGDAATLAARNRTDGLLKQTRATRELLAPWNGTQSVKDLDDTLGRLGLSA